MAVYHRGLLLIVIKYSSTVTRGANSRVTGPLGRSLNEIRGSRVYAAATKPQQRPAQDYFVCYGVLKTYRVYFIAGVKVSSNDPRPSITEFKGILNGRLYDRPKRKRGR